VDGVYEISRMRHTSCTQRVSVDLLKLSNFRVADNPEVAPSTITNAFIGFKSNGRTDNFRLARHSGPVCIWVLKRIVDTIRHMTHYAPTPRWVAAARQECLQTGLETLRRASQCALIISHKFLDTFICEFVCDVETLPGKV